MSDATIGALGKLPAALETVEHARGHPYALRRLSGSSDLVLQDTVSALRSVGHHELADEIDEVLVGRDIIDGQWSFQLVEKYDAGHWRVFRDVEQEARYRLGDVEPHVYEAEM